MPFLISRCLVLFEVIFLLRLDSLVSRSVFVTVLDWASLALKTSAANLLNSGVVIYSPCFFSISVIFVL